MSDARILEILKRCHDLGSMSIELVGEIVDLTTKFHFDPTRANVLRPFPFGPEDSVLEVGAGCGALTRWLAEQGASVTALESSPVGRQCIVERCRDLSNVPNVRESFKDLPDDGVFSVVTCIGGLEYADQSSHTGHTVADFLRHLTCRLKPGGRLFLAIDNKLGLKVLGGAAEEQTNTPYVGIHDLYDSTAARLFNKQELSHLLRSSGFSSLEWFYPFPDYYLPTLIISEEALHDGRLDVADLLSDLRPVMGTPDRAGLSWEPLVWRTVAKNGMLGELSNAFLVVARKEPWQSEKLSPSWLARRYSTSPDQLHSKETIFKPERSGVTIVRRRLIQNDALTPEPAIVPFRFTHVLADSTYIPGELYGPELYQILARGGTVDDMVRWMKPWVELLEMHTVPPPEVSWPFPTSMQWIAGNFIDCIPFNMVYASDGTLRFIDVEWQSHDPIPLPWVITRGVFYRLLFCVPGRSFRQFTYRSLLNAIFPRVGIDATEELFSVIAIFENAWMDFVYQKRRNRPADFALRLSRPIGEEFNPTRQLLAEFAEAKQTVGWRVLSVYWRTVERVFPRRSTRRRILDGIARVCRGKTQDYG